LGAFRELTEPHRRELQLHCYRVLGSVQDAEDLVQETLLAAWRGLETFEGRASVRSWLYRIAIIRWGASAEGPMPCLPSLSGP
jgi:DNA-directed RNA polymerase specialized sigma24 family protein